MSLDKVAIKNERPGIMLTPGLRPPDEDPEAPHPTEDGTVADEHEDRAPAKA